jgi:hypothetical protein
MGFGNGRVGRRFTLIDSVYGVVLAIALWMTIDLDYAGIGIIKVINRDLSPFFHPVGARVPSAI